MRTQGNNSPSTVKYIWTFNVPNHIWTLNLPNSVWISNGPSSILASNGTTPTWTTTGQSPVWTSSGPLTYTSLQIFQVIVFTVVCFSVDLFGMGTNIINIICFIKQGFKDPINVSLFGLAIADFFSLATLLWTNICLTPAFRDADLPFDSWEFQHPTSCVLHTTFTRLSGWITALITLERCLCITVPLKVKNILTPKRVSVVVVFTFMVLLSSVAPVYMVLRLGWKYFPERNRTLIGIIYTDDRETVERISYFINNVFIPFGSFIVIAVCTVIIVSKLRQSAKWRMQTLSNQDDKVSNRNQKVAKMVVMISTLFVICFFPLSVTFIAMALEPELSMSGKYSSYLVVLVGIGFFLESINSSVNIFFYYRMSTKYRTVFRQLFHIKIEDLTGKNFSQTDPSIT